jgi:hypothetical protein
MVASSARLEGMLACLLANGDINSVDAAYGLTPLFEGDDAAWPFDSTPDSEDSSETAPVRIVLRHRTTVLVPIVGCFSCVRRSLWQLCVYCATAAAVASRRGSHDGGEDCMYDEPRVRDGPASLRASRAEGTLRARRLGVHGGGY